MWCANCQADVAAEVSADNRHVRCATCSAVLDTPQTLRASARTREARELLERWSSGVLLDPFSPISSTGAPSTSNSAAATGEVAQPSVTSKPAAAPAASRPARRSFRVDGSHAGAGATIPASGSTSAAATTEGATVANAPPRTILRPRPLAQPAIPSAADAAEVATIPASTIPLPKLPSAAPIESEASDDYRTLAPSAEGEEGGSYDDEPHAVEEPAPRRRRGVSAPPQSPGPAAVPHLRHDDAESTPAPFAYGTRRPPVEAASASLRMERAARYDEPQNALAGPHIDPQAFAEGGARRSNSTSLAGQFLAYAGVLGLTVGTAMVLWGYFGGPEHFTPTGWLITTVGQMLLFLGVVTLVSGGMEQTTDEVARRIDHLGERLSRMEQAARDQQFRGAAGSQATREAADARPAPRRAVS